MELSEANYVNYDFLRSVLSSERSQSGLEQVKEDFFLQCAGFLKVQEDGLRENFSIEQAKVLENSRKIVAEVKDIRLRKILFKAFKDLEAGTVNSSGLSSEEKEFYRSVLSLLSSYKQDKRIEGVKVKVLVDLPEMQSPEGGSFGPFSVGQIASLNPLFAELLLQKNVVEKL
ncbi:MAG: hypothetical protein QXR53_00645 [Candidatus Norongarragalinales archaeon]